MDTSKKLDGMKVAILCTNGVEQSELESPKEALNGAGAEVDILSLESGELQAWKHHDAGDKFNVDRKVDEADADHYDALMLPGGVVNADNLRMNRSAVRFVEQMVSAKKPVAVICHGAWILIEANAVSGKSMTSWPSLQTDLRNAGATWADLRVVRDTNLVSSRKPDDLDDFNSEMIDLFAHSLEASEESGPVGTRKKSNSKKDSHSTTPVAQI